MSAAILIACCLPNIGFVQFYEQPEKNDENVASDRYQVGRNYLLKVVEARGGKENFEKLNALKSVVFITAIGPRGQKSATYENLEVLPDKNYRKTKWNGGEQTVVFNGSVGWSFMNGQVSKMSNEDIESNRALIWENSNLILADPFSENFSVEYKGENDFDGKRMHKLEFVTAMNGHFSWLIDTDTYLPIVRIEFADKSDDHIDEVITMGDYQEYDGILIATRAIRKKGGMEFRMKLQNMIINPDYDTSIFIPPSELDFGN